MKVSEWVITMSAACCLCACGSKNGGYDASGVFETTEVIVSAKGTGEIKRFDIEEGRQVTPGTCIGYIDTTQLYLKKRQLEASLKSTDSRYLDVNRQLAAIRQQIAIQQRERERFARLVQANAASQKQLDDIDYQIEVLEKQLGATAEQLTSSNSSLSGQSGSIVAQLAQLDDQIANNRIESPVAGTVLAKYAEPGEFAVPGRPLFKVGNLADMKLRAYITAGQLTQLKVGQQVTVYADEGESGRREYPGTVAWISDKAEFTPKTIQTRDERANLVYAVKIAVRNDGFIKKGMYGEIKL
ncbi:MAG: HlyD family efflux transporter periplasmic adaptor subunit [Parabacteroides sp.]|nr:HlyD family efflux transporter periplasmic adaptor subunit [Parabacteroides sp.]